MTASLLAACEVMYIDHLSVSTCAFEQTLRHYLGLPGSRLLRGPAADPAHDAAYAFVQLEQGMILEILGAAAGEPAAGQCGPQHFCYAVADLDAAVAKALAAGARTVNEAAPHVAFDGRRVAGLFHDSLGSFEFVEGFPRSLALQPGIGRACVGGQASPQPTPVAPPAAGKDAALRGRLDQVFSNMFPSLDRASAAKAEMNNTKEWDSLNHIRLIMALEEEFEINIDADEISRLTAYEIIYQALLKHI